MSSHYTHQLMADMTIILEIQFYSCNSISYVILVIHIHAQVNEVAGAAANLSTTNINTLTNKEANNEDTSGIADISIDTLGSNIGVPPAALSGHAPNAEGVKNQPPGSNAALEAGVGSSNVIAEGKSGQSDSVNINSQLNSNGDEEQPVTEAPTLHLVLGNATVGEACQLSKDLYHQLMLYYPHHCLTPEEADERYTSHIVN